MTPKLFFTPGPAQLYPTFETHLQTALRDSVGSISHRSRTFKAIYQHTAEQLRALLNIPSSSAILFTGSATEVWERVIQNCVERESFHLVNGAFSKRFYEFSGELGKQAEKVEVPFGDGFDVASISVPASAELVCLTHNETSSGVSMPVDAMHALKKVHPDKLFAVDIVSSAPYPALDFSIIDSAFFSVQKGFGMPAGLGVWIVNEKCLQKAQYLKSHGHVIGAHHSLPSLWNKAQTYETPATPNVLSIYLLGKIAEDMNRTGIATIRRETEHKAARLYEFLNTENGVAQTFVRPSAYQSQTVIVANSLGNSTDLIQKMTAAGCVVGSGYGNYKEKQIRIANFPTHSPEQIGRLIDELRKSKMGGRWI